MWEATYRCAGATGLTSAEFHSISSTASLEKASLMRKLLLIIGFTSVFAAMPAPAQVTFGPAAGAAKTARACFTRSMR